MEATETITSKEAIKPLSDVEKLTQPRERDTLATDECWLHTIRYSCYTDCPQTFKPLKTKTTPFRSDS